MEVLVLLAPNAQNPIASIRDKEFPGGGKACFSSFCGRMFNPQREHSSLSNDISHNQSDASSVSI